MEFLLFTGLVGLGYVAGFVYGSIRGALGMAKALEERDDA